MSGIEIAGLAVGVLPILVELVKSYSTILRKARTLRHHGKVIRSLATQLDTQNGIFLNEVRLLLRSVEEENVIETMLENANDYRWTSSELSSRLRWALRENFSVCRNIVEEIGDSIEELREDLALFDVFWEGKPKGESIKSVIKRLKGVVDITLDESRHTRCIASLRDKNGDLSRLRTQIDALQGSTEVKKHRGVPENYAVIQTAARKLHEALCEAWCCDDPAHRGHYAKLCLDAHVQSEVRLDLAISCHEPEIGASDDSAQLPPIWLHVQSMSTSRGKDAHPAPYMPAPHVKSTLSLGLLASCPVNVLKKKPSSDLERSIGPCKKLKQTNITDDSSAATVLPIGVPTAVPMRIIEFNLCRTKNMCRYIRNHHETMQQAANAKRCIGYLESPQMYRHHFYFRDNDLSVGRDATKLHSVFDVMRCDVVDAMSIEDQLRLAHKTSRAILQYNDTPWLSNRWRLRDMRYFGPNDALDEYALKTLHVSSQLSSPTDKPTVAYQMEDVQGDQFVVSDEIRYGINNVPLFFLGVALLEIAHWKPIEDQMTSKDHNDEVWAARRIASQPTQLGPVYQKIARKCLQCNFGAEPDLKRRTLQTAVYNDVICELESMIATLEIS